MNIATLKSKLAKYKADNPDSNSLQIIWDTMGSATRLVMAKIYLRKCTHVGRMVSVNGKPMINNRGEISLGDEVRVWSKIIQAKILTGKGGRIIVGKNSRLNGVHIYAGALVSIGKNVRIAPYSIILDSDFHDVNNHFADGMSVPIIIEDDVWIATRATILKGVTIGKGAVVATGAVVTRDVKPYTVVAGVPARQIKELNPPTV